LELELAISRLQDDSEDSEPDAEKLEELSALYSRTKALIIDLSTRDTDGIIPTWSTVQNTIAMAQDKTLPKTVDEDFDHIAESFRIAYSGRRLFRTNDNYLGIGARSLQAGDAVWVIAGAAVPMVLRRLPNGHWKLVGEVLWWGSVVPYKIT
jgi:hypothetical protein